MAKRKNAPVQGPDYTKPRTENPFPVAGIGASAGGVTALKTFLSEIPGNTGAAYVIIVHLAPSHESELAEILARNAHMPVRQVNARMPLEPDTIYVIPPDRRLLITQQDIATFPFEEPRGLRLPIDEFFRSLADQRGDGFAVILTGAGADGALGVKAIKEGGGIVLVQDPNEAEYPSMPRSAIMTGDADFVLPLKELAEQLVDLIRTKAKLPVERDIVSDEDTLKRILAHLHLRTGHDFLRYKRSTLYRRLARRMQMCKVASLAEYLNFIKRKPEECQSLFHDLLISVTTFFRDPSAFEALAKIVIPRLYEMDGASGPIRVWVPGCASGEEAYSIAMVFADEAARRETRMELQIFASDLDTSALAIAREGQYPLAIESDVSEERLRKYFTKEAGHYRIRRELRDMVLFANHSLLKDPPFSKLHLISCRNLLIYLEKDLQQQVLITFNYALRPGGFLFLGSSEAAEHPSGLFHPLDRDARIFQVQVSATGHRELPHLLSAPRVGELPAPGPAAATVELPPDIHQRALEMIAPPSMLVDINHQIVNMSEDVGRFVMPSGGQLRNDIAELVRPELRFDLRAALHAAFERNQPTLSMGIPVQFNGTPRRVFLQVKPVSTSHGGPRQAVVFFIEGDAVNAPADDGERDQTSDDIIRRLKDELELTRSRLRASREEYEAANEELRAANEELQSINEEHRSTAEELETSKEELQSMNEELQTVNAELKNKLDSVSRTNNDLQNLMASTDVGTLFLDSQLRINRFTPRISELFNIKEPDQGRSITDFTRRLDYPSFTEDAQSVLRDLKFVEREIRGNGNWYLTRLRPYRTLDDRIEGVVCTFVDITERRKTQEALKTTETRLRTLLGELSHRVKNILAVVQSLARQSFQKNGTSEERLEAFSNRLEALADAHSLLVSSDWRGANLRELAERVLGLFAAGGERISMQGPEVAMPPDLATPFALMLHELATNAVKYGALSTPSGLVRLEWAFQDDGGKRQLRFAWRETGGPKVEPPEKGGFGSWVIKNGLPDAQVNLSYPEDGVVCTAILPEEALRHE